MSDIVERLPCDVLVQPATLIKRGCRIETLLECIEMRRERSEKGPPLNDILSRRQADEILALRKEVEAVRDLLVQASALQIGPSSEGHRIAIYFEDYNEAGKLFAILSDRAALATESVK